MEDIWGSQDELRRTGHIYDIILRRRVKTETVSPTAPPLLKPTTSERLPPKKWQDPHPKGDPSSPVISRSNVP